MVMRTWDMAGDWQELSLREAGVSLLDCEHRTPPAADSGYPYIAIPQIKYGRIDLAGVRRIIPPIAQRRCGNTTASQPLTRGDSRNGSGERRSRAESSPFPRTAFSRRNSTRSSLASGYQTFVTKTLPSVQRSSCHLFHWRQHGDRSSFNWQSLSLSRARFSAVSPEAPAAVKEYSRNRSLAFRLWCHRGR